MAKRQDENESNESEQSEKKDNEADAVLSGPKVRELIKQYEQKSQSAQNTPTQSKNATSNKRKKDVESEGPEQQSEERKDKRPKQ